MLQNFSSICRAVMTEAFDLFCELWSVEWEEWEKF